jgi:hypothetical protein
VKILAQLSFVSLILLLVGCTTLANRRDLYFPETVEGPYTRMLREGIPAPETDSSAVQGSSDFKNVR